MGLAQIWVMQPEMKLVQSSYGREGVVLGNAFVIVVSYHHRPLDHGFVYSRLWCISFAGCITFGAVGRRLAAGD